ncbi:MAG: helix-turn-helix domain-containing protein [Bacteroidales bacterium]|nr:helix-turn-helix domain-containing protein [Bacteroidales bacterium]
MKPLLLSLIILLSGFAAAQSDVQEQKDSLRKALTLTEGEEKLLTYFRLTNLYYPEAFDEMKRDTLLALYDEWDAEEERQNARHRTAIRTNKLFMFQKVGLYDEVIKLAPEYLQFMAEQEAWVAYYQAYMTLVRAYNKTDDNDNALIEAQKMYEHARLLNNKGGLGSAFYAMSDIYGSQRRFVEQEKSLKEAITLLQEVPRYYGLLANSYNSLCSNYIAQEQYNEALNVARELEAFLPRYEKELRSPQPNAWSNLWSVYLKAYRNLGDYKKAEFYLNEIEKISGNEVAPLYEARAHILMGYGRYAEALDMANKGIADYPLSGRGELRAIKIKILAKMGDIEGLSRQLNEYVAELDAIHDVELNAGLDEIRTRYEVDILERDKNSAIAEKQRNRNYFFFALGGCFLLTLTLGIWIYYSRRIVRKNRILYKQIMEESRMQEALQEAKQALLLQSSEKQAEENQNGNVKTQVNVILQRLGNLMQTEKLFTNPELSRKELANRLFTNEIYLINAIRDGYNGQIYSDYINSFRLKHAHLLLQSNPEFSIKEIAGKAGFSSYKYFHQLFRDKFGMSPSAFRKISKEQSNA